MRKLCPRIAAAAVVVLLSGSTLATHGYEIDTHEEISLRAATRSSADRTLKDSIGLGKGINETVNGKTLLSWIGFGSRVEDRFPRFFNHFHDPLATNWLEAGLGGAFAQSSILWAQNSNQEFPSWSWVDTRAYFLEALTLTTRAGRERRLADTFRGLGQAIHLVQDAASPGHTRRDPHVFYNYESLVLDLEAREPGLFQSLLTGLVAAPDPAWQTLASNDLAPIPIARLLDTDRYLGDNPGVTTEALIGIAEYTNANFFSEDTVFKELESNPTKRIPFPARTSTQVQASTIVLPGSAPIEERTVQRLYYAKTGDGDVGYRLATVGFLRDYLVRYSLDVFRMRQKPALDEMVYRDYAARLLPRARTYSTAMLDYFFRGSLEASIQPVTDPETGLLIPHLLELVATNTSPDPLGPGTLTVYVDDDGGVRQPVLTPDSTPPATQVILRDVPIALTPKDAPLVAAGGTPIRFKPPVATTRYTVVYQGDLGQERRGRPAGFLGATVAKVLGGQQAEALVPQGAQRLLRSVEGVFPLPQSIDGLEGLQFGDLDNTFVGFTATAPGSGAPAQVSAFRIRRPLGSATVPREAGPSDAEIVSLDTLKAVNFPFGLALGTSVRWRQTTRFQQPLITYTRTVTCVFSHMHPNPHSVYTPVSDVPGGGEIDPAVDQTFVFSAEFPIVLDQAHLFGSTALTPRPYYWRAADVGLDAQGRLLAIVAVQLSEPEDSLRPVTLRARDRTCAPFDDP